MHHTPKIRINLQTGYNNRHEYNIKDHLGNTRVCFTPPTDNTTTPWIIQQTNYYAYGLPIKNLTTTYNTPLVGGTPSLVNRYQYNGKEFETDLGLMWNDYGARWYDPQNSRWTTIDPLAEKYAAWSGYNYVMGNPIRNIDPDGRGVEDPIFHTVQKGETLSSISKQYGVSVQDLVYLNGINDPDKINYGTTLKVNPEMDFSCNPHGKYSNPSNSMGEVVSMDNIANIGVGFVMGAGPENVVVANGGALESIQNWDKVKSFIAAGTEKLKSDGELTSGEVITRSYSPGSLTSYMKEVVKGNEKLVSPVHVIGSFNFSMRVNADGNTATIAIYDSKTASSFSDNKAGESVNTQRSASQGNQPLTTQYIRFIWTQTIK